VDLLKAPFGKPAEFSLRPRYLRDSSGAAQLSHFTVDYPSGYMADGWLDATFVPMGSAPVTGIEGLPAWHSDHSATYREVIGGADSLDNSGTLRLQGVVPFVGKSGGVGYDTVRIYYVPNAVTGGDIRDLVVIKTSALIGIPGTLNARQDGAGQGPPKQK
jgi:hypothetical protein